MTGAPSLWISIFMIIGSVLAPLCAGQATASFTLRGRVAAKVEVTQPELGKFALEQPLLLKTTAPLHSPHFLEIQSVDDPNFKRAAESHPSPDATEYAQIKIENLNQTLLVIIRSP